MSTTHAEALTFAAAHARLKGAQKSSKGAPAYSLYVNRPLGRVLAAGAYRIGLTPNQVTCLSAVSSFAGIAILALLAPSWLVGALVCLTLVLGYGLDAADGQLARLRGGGSAVGEWLDHMIDAAKISSLHLAVLVMAYRHLDATGGWLLVPLVFAVVSAVHFFGMILVEQLTKGQRPAQGPMAPTSRARTLMKLPTDYGVLCLSFALLGAPMHFLVAYAVLAAGTAGYLVLILPKWRNDIAALDPLDARRA
jgi:phosphatidylglycerophosphate synthase